MNKSRIENLKELDGIIQGRIEPYIYAFSTNTIPNYLKIGDTYRGVLTRLNEWRFIYPCLEKKYENKALVNDHIYFRDFSIHQFLEQDLNKQRLQEKELSSKILYSKEFFKDTISQEIDKAIEDIKDNYNRNTGKYKYYKIDDKASQDFQYQRGESWTLRPNQQLAVDKFVQAWQNGRTNLLMYAVMRFGKSFTALCCALEMKANLVLVVSAKADVKEEWKKTVESAGNFKDYRFLDSENLSRNPNAIKDTLSSQKVVIFLTLQDLQGNKTKAKHKELLNQLFDLLIIDETHFGARAQSFGQKIENTSHSNSEQKYIKNLNDEVIDPEIAKEQVNSIKAKIKLHLSGTPYQILMGSEFEKEDVISFVQFYDIFKEQEQWNKDNLYKDNVNEWDNPYYGFPQMIRFAFNPNESSRRKMEELKSTKISVSLSDLFEPQSIIKDRKEMYKKFTNQNEVLDLLQVIDGSKEDEDLLGFLDYDKIKQGNMCRHMVMVLPYCASCDAMEELIKSNKNIFKNLGDYEIINISGLNARRKYRKPIDIKNKIRKCEKENKKTLTLTVNRMLTGSTVEQWDSMLYLKDSSSPQEYDQSIFRLQNQYIRILKNKDGDLIKENLKPQTLLVDFDPNRMFRMQEQKSLIYNANIEQNGNSKLRDRIAKELRISPIIVMNKNKIHQVEPSDILKIASEYNNQKSILDKVLDIPIDFSILNDKDVRMVIQSQGEFNSKQGLEITPFEGIQDELNIDELNDNNYNSSSKDEPSSKSKNKLKKDKLKKLEKQIRTYYQRLLFFAFLTKDKVHSLDDILNVINKKENNRIAENLQLEKEEINKMSKSMKNPFKKSMLDYKIQNTSMLAHDEELTPLERTLRAIKNFNRMSEYEIITPSKICDDMVNSLPKKEIKQIVRNKEKFLDIASKSGEYALALYKRLTNELEYHHDEIKDLIYSIPTSSVAYEFTRKFYEILDLNLENISSHFNSINLIEENHLKEKDTTIADTNLDFKKINNLLTQDKKFSEITMKDEIKPGDNMIKFGAVVGNPPYQKNLIKNNDNLSLEDESQIKKNTSLSKQLFPYFVMIGMQLSNNYTSMIIPARWFAGKGQDGSFVKFRKFIKNKNNIFQLHLFEDSQVIFEDVKLAGGVCYFLSDRKNNEKLDFIKHNSNEKETKQERELFFGDLEFILRDKRDYFILAKILKNNFASLNQITQPRNAFGISGKNEYVKKISKEQAFKNGYELMCRENKIRYISRDKVLKNKELFDNYKIFISKTAKFNPLDKKILKEPLVANRKTACTDSFIPIGNFKSLKEAKSLEKYIKTRFFRFFVSLLKISQNTCQNVYEFVPMQNFTSRSDIDWAQSIGAVDEQLFNKYNLSTSEKEYIKTSIEEMN
ncbi:MULTISPECIES: Eco57I restriction-modification methylase domain-containing protein [unclassified Mycoplasma]|uniref:Eco57I restriction-modification methylase domain-containing protein n=1 Tax=unclassified Mycoplasma TaxID=2683645 RepID=UPI00211C4B14|nr:MULTISPECIES: Eco57I restriction-modification methylase domain-containing protein [unclassified Mycoplasma]UUM20135.1 Eco57I restriction-modification methylase domain-containing protein [Mycoplasma sp. 1578d]UUM25115.1 Eco57I restriction-modification methylase domain-containing protein [Mycoplasma sp. 3686d]